MSKTTINDVAQLLKGDNKKGDSSFWGVVQSLIYNDDDEVIGYNVSIDSDGQTGTIKCNKVVGAKEGDQVFVVLRANGEAVVTSTKGGDADAADAQATADQAQADATEAKETAEDASETATSAYQKASNAENYFWADSSGAHVAMAKPIVSNTINTLINSGGMAIRKGTTELAKFTDSLIELGKNSTSAIISFCGGKGKLSYNQATQRIAISTARETTSTVGKGLTMSSDGNTYNSSRAAIYFESDISTQRTSDTIAEWGIYCENDIDGDFSAHASITGNVAVDGDSGYMSIEADEIAIRGDQVNVYGRFMKNGNDVMLNAVGPNRIMDWGTINISVSGSTKKTGSITFNASFTSPPFVFVTPYASGKVNATVSSVTTSGGTINAWCDDSSSGSTAFRWLAIGVV